jgi:hypothetical protein
MRRNSRAMRRPQSSHISPPPPPLSKDDEEETGDDEHIFNISFLSPMVAVIGRKLVLMFLNPDDAQAMVVKLCTSFVV